jgi:predicted phage-related endonuclease
MKTHDLIQGSPEWLAFRSNHHGASEAAAMLGLSEKVRRSELLHVKHTGSPREFSDWVQEHILDPGHDTEARARVLLEKQIGDLYPVTCSDGSLSASVDGLTVDDRIAFEHKRWNETYGPMVRAGQMPIEHMPQCQQVLMVTGAERLVFVVSDGTAERWAQIDVLPDPQWFERIRAGWAQFEADLAAYVPPETAPPAPVGKAPETLPALRIEITGAVTASNLAEFKATALAAIRSVNRDLTTDQNFADADKAVKWCADVEERLKAAKEHALSQTATIDQLFKTIDDIAAEARTVRLDLDKLVTKRKAEIKDGIILKARQAWGAHVDELNAELEPLRLNVTQPDFVAAAKNKRTVATLQDAVDTELANGKIAADATARDWRAKLAWQGEEAAEHLFLFHDLQQLIAKPLDDFKLAVTARIDAHKKAEADKKQREEDAKRIADQALQTAAAPAPAVQPVAQVVAQARPAPAVAPAASEPATLKLGTICERLGFTMTAAFVADTLGVPHAATDKAAKLYRERQFGEICRALMVHIGEVAEQHAAA